MIVTDAYRRNYAEIVWTPLPPSPRREQQANTAPYVIRDEMDPVFHPATGQILDSKSNFRKITRERGLTEVGNDAWPTRVPERVPKPGPDIKRAIEELRSR